MRKSTKTTAILLTVAMVVAAFCVTFTASAEGENLLAGMDYTLTVASFQPGFEDTEPASLLTDGAYRGDGTNDWNGISGVKGVTIENAGSYADTVAEFEFEEATSIGTVVIKNARAFFLDASCNRHCHVREVKVSTDGMNFEDAAFTVEYKPVEGAPELKGANEEVGPQYFDIVIALTGAEDVYGLQITCDTERPADVGGNGYICQFDEIEAYAPGGEAPPAPPASEEAPPAPPASEEAPPAPPASEEAPPAPPASEEAPPTPPASEEAPPAVVAPITYTVTITDNGDGTATVTAALPAGVGSGKIVITPSANLTYIDKSLKSEVDSAHLDPDGEFPQAPMVLKNANYDRDGVAGQCVSFVGPLDPSQPDYHIPEGAIALKANYTIAADAELSADDIVVKLWDLSDGKTRLGSQEDGSVAKICNVPTPPVSEEAPPTPPASEEAPPTPPASEEAPPTPPVSEEAPPTPPASEEAPPTPPASEEAPPVPVAPVTYTVRLTDNLDGTATITAIVPAGVLSGKIVVTPSANLTYIEGTLKSDVLKLADPDDDNQVAPILSKNPAYDVDGVKGQCVSFVGPVDPDKTDNTMPEGTVVLTANYKIAEGAELSEKDIIVGLWNLAGQNEDRLGTEEDGDVVKVYKAPPLTPESSQGGEQSQAPGPVTPTGDVGMAAFAILALISGAAVVVLKKKA